MIAYASRTLTRAERQYCATRREMPALVWGIHQFRPYLYVQTFSARTDHNSLKWLHNFREPEGQAARWLEFLSEYNFHVLHRPGVQHRNADALSHPCKQCGETQDQEVAAALHATIVQRGDLHYATTKFRPQANCSVAILTFFSPQMSTRKYLSQDIMAPEELPHPT